MHNFSIAIPTLNAGVEWVKCLDSIKNQTAIAKQLLILDSDSSDPTPEIAKDYGWSVISVDRKTFNHGVVRNQALKLCPSELIVFLTQDAILASKFSLENLLESFHDLSVGMAYGRQIPHIQSKPLGAHARLFNYPDYSQIRKMVDAKRLGIKTAFVSNSFAAYRCSALVDQGGFPEHVILSEDTYVAAKMLLSGWSIAYAAEAKVFHSHDYSFIQEFKRYFDTGVFYGRERWITEKFGKSESEGVKFVKSELRYLLRNAPQLIPSAFLRTFLKYFAFKIGQNEKILTSRLKCILSMHKNYWMKEL